MPIECFLYPPSTLQKTLRTFFVSDEALKAQYPVISSRYLSVMPLMKAIRLGILKLSASSERFRDATSASVQPELPIHSIATAARADAILTVFFIISPCYIESFRSG